MNTNEHPQFYTPVSDPEQGTTPPFAMLDYIAHGVHQQGQTFAETEGRLAWVEQHCQCINQFQSEIIELLQQVKWKTFPHKEEGFKVGILTSFSYSMFECKVYPGM